MDILFYSPHHSQKESELLYFLKNNLQYNVIIPRDLDDFPQCSNNRIRNAVAIVYAQTLDDLIDIYFHHHLFLKMPLVLLLPDMKKDTIALGERLRPVYIECVQDNSRFLLPDIIGIIDQSKKSYAMPSHRK